MPLVLASWTESADLLARGQRAFTGQRFYEAQTLWEAEALATTGDARTWVQGLATIAAGMLAHDEHRVGAAERLLMRGRWLLATAPALYGSADVNGARALADRVIAALRN